MKKLIIIQFTILSIITISLSSCKKSEEDTIRDEDGTNLTEQERDKQKIDDLFQELESISSSQYCTNGDDWRITPYGSKACGGPMGYLAYSIKIDTTNFLNKVNEHRKLQNDYNIKYGVFSTCDIIIEPIGVVCQDGKPTFYYKTF